MAEQHSPTARDASTLSSVLAAAERDGFAGDFVVRSGARDAAIQCDACGTSSPAGSFERSWRWRLEGASDPDDMLDVSALHCPVCGAGGTLVTPFGSQMSAEEADVSTALARPTGEPPVAT
jgi:hypothetical protein